MRENKGFVVVCSLIGIGVFISLYGTEHDDSFFNMLLFLGIILSWFILCLIAVYRIFNRDYLPWKKRLVPFYLLLTPLVTLTGWNICNGILHKKRDWLVVESYDFTGSNIILFKKDGEYQYRRNSPLGRSAPVFGRYERRDSLLILQPASGEGRPIIVRLAIRPYVQFEKHQENSSARLIALDSAGKSLDAFRITQRNY